MKGTLVKFEYYRLTLFFSKLKLNYITKNES